jgi:hypothetical protein
MPKPQIIKRPSETRKKYIPIGETEFSEIMKLGLLKVVPLTAKGRAKGITLESIIEYQRRFMGIEPLPDDALEAAPRIAGPHDTART